MYAVNSRQGTSTVSSPDPSPRDGLHAQTTGIDVRDPGFWKTSVGVIKHALREERGNNCADIHAIVARSLANAGAPRWLLEQHELNVRHIPGAWEEDFDSRESEFARCTADTLGSLVRHEQLSQGSRPCEYGGGTGDEVFKSFATDVAVPTLCTLIGFFDQNTSELPESELYAGLDIFLPVILDEAARCRGLVARMTGTADAEKFGARRHPDRYMGDEVSAMPDWRRWESRIAGQIQEAVSGSKEVDLMRGCDVWPGGNNPWPEDARCHLRVFTFAGKRVVLNPALKEGVYDDGVKFGTRYTFRWDHVDGEQADRITLGEMVCEHAMVRRGIPIEGELRSDFLGLLRRDGHSQDDVRKHLAGILHTLSHSSTFSRGQAAITDWLLKALAEHCGFTLTYSRQWSAQEGLAPDVQALCHFSKDEFVAASAAHMRLSQNPESD